MDLASAPKGSSLSAFSLADREPLLQSARRYVILVAQDKKMLYPDGQTASRAVLGHQYLLGLIPFTNLYFEHGANSLLLETSLDRFSAAGYAVAVSDEQGLQTAAELLQPALIVRPELSPFSINAYDAIFFRILSLAGRLSLFCYEPSRSGGLSAYPCAQAELAEDKYRASAHGPALSLIAEDSLADGLRRSLKQIMENYQDRRFLAPPSSVEPALPRRGVSVVFVALPSMEGNVPPAVASMLASSYGFASIAPYSARTVQRLVQRGIEGALAKAGISSVALDRSGTDFNGRSNSAESVWLLEPQVHLLEAVESEGWRSTRALRLALSFRLVDLGRASHPLLLAARCAAEVSAPREHDGYWVVALENAAALQTEALIGAETAPPPEVACQMR